MSAALIAALPGRAAAAWGLALPPPDRWIGPAAYVLAGALAVLPVAGWVLRTARDALARRSVVAPSRERWRALAAYLAVALIPAVLSALVAALGLWLLDPLVPVARGLWVLVPFLAAAVTAGLTGAALLAFGPPLDARLRRLPAMVGGILALLVAARLLRPAGGAADPLALACETLAAAIALYTIHRYRHSLRQLLRRESATPDEDKPTIPERLTSAAADSWHLLGYALVLAPLLARYGLFGEAHRFGLARHLAMTLLMLAAAGVGVLLCERLHGHVLTRMNVSTGAGLHDRLALRLGRVLRTGAQAAVVVLALVGTAEVWGTDAWLGRTATRALLALLTTSAALYALWFIWTLVDTVLDWSASQSLARGTRIRTLMPFLRNVAFVSVSTLAVISILSNLGVDVAPLLAGAGVLGIAIGIGAQKLVGDIITGIFIIFEDSIALGEVVEAAGKTGVVEGLTIRTLKLRDGDGALHSIPFSSITTLKNTSRGYGAYTISVTILHPEDTDRALAELERLGEEIARDPAWADAVTGPFTLWGVDEIAPTGVVIKGNIRSQPNAQWGLGRELNRRIAVRFSELGIPQVQPFVPALGAVDPMQRPA